MSRCRHLSHKEARNAGKLERFAAEHQSDAEHSRFKALLEAVSKGAF